MSADIRTYAQRLFVSNELRRLSAADVDRMIQVDLERKAQAEGYVMVPGSFKIRYVQPTDAVDPTDPDVIFARDGNLAIVFASLRCYAVEATE